MKSLKTVTIAAVLCAFAGGAFAQTDDCKVAADAKKLSGAARTSSIRSCCDKQAVAKKLSGAAKQSSSDKCVKDAGG